jgi:hypothetical protein
MLIMYKKWLLLAENTTNTFLPLPTTTPTFFIYLPLPFTIMHSFTILSTLVALAASANAASGVPRLVPGIFFSFFFWFSW